MFWSPTNRTSEAAGTLDPDFFENEKSYSLSFYLPGVKKKDLKLETEDNTISISAIREKRSGEKISFERSFRLPSQIDFSKLDAKFEHGVLEITLPKLEASQKKEIEIH